MAGFKHDFYAQEVWPGWLNDIRNSPRRAVLRIMAQLMAPMVPHLAEEVWSKSGGQGMVVDAGWPKADPALLEDDSVTLPIQINGKRRAEITVPKTMAKSAAGSCPSCPGW